MQKSASEAIGKTAAHKTPPANGDPAKPEGTAATAMQTLADAIRNGRSRAVWDFLPAGYRQDVNELVRSFGAKMDAELWSSVFSLLGEVVEVLESKRDFILAAAPAEKRTELDGRWSGLVAGLKWLAASELSDVSRMKAFDGGEFLAKVDPAALDNLAILFDERNPLSMLGEMRKGVKVALVHSQGDAAVVRIAPTDGHPREFRMVKVAGKWIAQSTAADWKEQIEKSKKRIERNLAPERLQQTKLALLPQLQAAGQAVEQMQQAKSAGEFAAIVARYPLLAQAIEALTQLGRTSAGSLIPQAPPKNAAPTAAGRPVTIVVERVLDAKSAEAVADALFELAPNLDVAPFVVRDGRTEFPVSPVGDPSAFARRIRFARVARIDNDKRRIVIVPK